ncbi:hypothetical protein AB9F38_34275, partial [Rhizobium leguminosarum]
KVNGDLRLDLPDDTTAHLTAVYNFYREDTDDPDAIADAAQQSDVQEFPAFPPSRRSRQPCGVAVSRRAELLGCSAGVCPSRGWSR